MVIAGKRCIKTLRAALVVALWASVSAVNGQSPAWPDVIERLEAVERQNAALAADNRELWQESRWYQQRLDALQASLDTNAAPQTAMRVPTAPASNLMFAPEPKDEAAAAQSEIQKQLQKIAASIRVGTVDPCTKVALFGYLRGEMLISSARPLIPGAPTFISPETGLDQHSVDVHGRSTGLGAVVAGPRIGRYQSGGLVLVYFFGNTVLDNTSGLFFAQGFGELKSEQDRIAFGLQKDVLNPLEPTTLNWGVYNGAGNAGFIRGQLRYERFIKPSPNMQITLTGALTDPSSNQLSDFGEVSLTEDNGWPNIEGRAALGLGPVEGEGLEARRPIEFGVSGVVGELRTTDLALQRVENDVWAVGVDARVALTEWCGVQGELFRGQGLGSYSAGIVQTINLTTYEAIRTEGGWGEFYVYYTPRLHSHFGYLLDDPRDEDLSLGQRRRNEVVFGNLIWDVTRNFQVGYELSFWETQYVPALLDNTSTIHHVRLQYQF